MSDFQYGVSSEPLLRVLHPNGHMVLDYFPHSVLCELTRLMNPLQYERFLTGASVILPDGRNVKECNPHILMRKRG